VWRALGIGAICLVVAGVASASPANDVHAWVTTAIPQTALRIAGKGPRLSALSSDGRVAVVADSRGAYLFHVSSEGSWGANSKPSAKLRVPRSRLANLSAVALSSDGTTVLVAVGAVGSRRAEVLVFRRSSPGAWRLSARLTNAADPAGFGSGVALSSDGTTALVGNRGGAGVFHVKSADSWRDSSAPTATLVADPLGAEVGGTSTAVALSADGTTALLGTTSDSTFVGAAYVFRAVAPGAWVSSPTPEAILTDGYVGQFGDDFGAAVALSPDGRTALVGAPDLASGPAGAAYLFQVRKPDAWTTTSHPDAILERATGEVPGWSVALSGDGTALVGEPSIFGRNSAAVLSHTGGPDRSWSPGTSSRARLSNAASPPRDLFGAAVSLSSDGTTALVSSVRSSFVFTRAGSRSASYCYVPYVTGDMLRSARRAIESTRCRVGKISHVLGSRARSGRVISQRPRPGERLVKGTGVNLKVSERRGG